MLNTTDLEMEKNADKEIHESFSSYFLIETQSSFLFALYMLCCCFWRLGNYVDSFRGAGVEGKIFITIFVIGNIEV